MRYIEQDESHRNDFLDPSPDAYVPGGLIWAPSSGPGARIPKKIEFAKKHGTIPLRGARRHEATNSIEEAATNYFFRANVTHENLDYVDAVISAYNAARCQYGHDERGYEEAQTLREIAIQDAPLVAEDEELLDEFSSRTYELRTPLVINASTGWLLHRTFDLREIKLGVIDPAYARRTAQITLARMTDGILPCAQIVPGDD